MKRTLRLALVIVLAAAPAAAIEFRSAVRTQTGYDSNALSGRGGDMVVEVSPRVELIDPDGRFTWDFTYRPTYRYFVTNETDGGFSHIVDGRGSYQLTPKIRFEVSDRYARLKNVDLEDTFGLDDPTSDLIDTEVDARRTLTNRATARMDWIATTHDQLGLVVDHTILEYDSEGRGDFSSIQGAFSYRRVLTSRHTAGFDLSVRNNVQEQPQTGVERSTRFYSLQGAWSWEITPTLSFVARAGPALVDAEELSNRADQFTVATFSQRGAQFVGLAGCDQVRGQPVRSAGCVNVERTVGTPQLFAFINPVESANAVLFNTGPGVNQTEAQEYFTQISTIRRDPTDRIEDDGPSLTYFADVSITKTWEHIEWVLRYVRSASTSASDLGSSTVADQVQSILSWNPGPRTNFRFSAGWIRREQERSSTIDSVAVVPVNLPGCAFPETPLLMNQCPDTPVGALFFGSFEDVGRASQVVSRSVDLSQIQDQFIFQVNGRYQLRQNLFLTGGSSYRIIQSDAVVGGNDDDDRWRVLFGLEYRFEPIIL